MSRKSHRSGAQDRARKPDRRVASTRNRLGDALIALILQKPFDTITVQQVLELAHVSRSAFYTHYKDKDDLLLSDAEDFFDMVSTMLTKAQEKSDRVVPVRELFEHVREAAPLLKALAESGRNHDVMEQAQGSFARGIEQRLADSPRGQRIPKDQRSALAHAHAGALLSLMTWWLQRGSNRSPAQMDDLFHAMFWYGVSSASAGAARVTPTIRPSLS